MANIGTTETEKTIIQPDVKFVSDPDKPENIQGVITYPNNFSRIITGLGRPDQVLFNLGRESLLIKTQASLLTAASFIVLMKGICDISTITETTINRTGPLTETILNNVGKLPYLLIAVMGVAEIAIGIWGDYSVNNWSEGKLSPLNLLRDHWIKRMSQVLLDGEPATPAAASEGEVPTVKTI